MFDAAPDPRPLQQSPEFAAAIRRFGGDAFLQDGRLFLRRRLAGLRLSMLPRCPLEEPQHLLESLPRGPVILSPDAPCPDLARLGALPLATPATTAMLTLDRNLPAMRAAMHQKWRNRLRHAEKSGLRVTCQPMPPDPDHWLLRAEEAQARDRRYRGWPKSLTLAWIASNPTASRLFVARKGKDPVAAMLFLLHGHGATYHVGHSGAAGRACSAHNLLLWTAMRSLAQRGTACLDLGLVDTAAAPGLARFKLGSGAAPHRLGGTWLWWKPLRRAFGTLARLDRRRMT